MTATDIDALLASDFTDATNRGALSDAIKERGDIDLTPNAWRVIDGTAGSGTLRARDRRLAAKVIRLALLGEWVRFWALFRRSGRVSCGVSHWHFDGEHALSVSISLGSASLVGVRICGDAWVGMSPTLAFTRAGMGGW